MTRSDYLTEAATRKPRDRNLYATDGRCHNAQHGTTYAHECGKPASWIGTSKTGWQSGFCDHCKAHGDERHGMITWEERT